MNNNNNRNMSTGIHQFSAYNPPGMHVSWPDNYTRKKQQNAGGPGNMYLANLKTIMIKVKKYFTTQA